MSVREVFYALTSTAIHSFFQTKSLSSDLLFSTVKKVGKKGRSRAMLFIQLLGRFSRSFATRLKHFKLVNHTFMIIGTQSRLLDNRYCIVLPFAFHGGRLSSCSTGRSRASKESSFTHANCPAKFT
jgi:hypothetical protein